MKSRYTVPTPVLDEDFVEVKPMAKRDSRGHIAVGAHDGGEQYSVSRNAHGQYLLTPVVNISAHEAWLYNNPDAIESIRNGLADVAAGRVHEAGSFAQYADADDEG